MPIHRAARIAAAGLGVSLIAGAIAVITASAAGLMAPATAPSSKPKPPTAYCDAFIGHLAANLGKTPYQVRSATVQAAGQTIDEAVKSGDLTAAQADAAGKRLSGAEACPPGVAGLGHHELGPDLGAAYVNAEAKALGISRDELLADLKQKGMSLHQIAESRGISQDQYKAAFLAALKSELDADVQRGTLTQKQEDQMLARVQSEPVPFWDRPAPHPKPGDKTKTGT